MVERVERLEDRCDELERRAGNKVALMMNARRIAKARATFEVLEYSVQNKQEVVMLSMDQLEPMLELGRLTLLCDGEEPPW